MIRLVRCWSESLLGAQVILLVLSSSGPFLFSFLTIFLPACLCVQLTTCLSVYVSDPACLPSNLFTYLPALLPIYPPVCLSFLPASIPKYIYLLPVGNMSKLHFWLPKKYHNRLHSWFDCNTFCRNIKFDLMTNSARTRTWTCWELMPLYLINIRDSVNQISVPLDYQILALK